MASKSQEKRIEVQKSAQQVRYVCHGCTKPAAYDSRSHTGTVTCPHCGLTQVCKLENWILMSNA